MFLQRHRPAVRTLSKAIQTQIRPYTQSSAGAVLQPDLNAEGSSFPRPDPKYNETIFPVPHAESGKSISAKERKAGQVPTIVFEQEDGLHSGNKCLISVHSNQI